MGCLLNFHWIYKLNYEKQTPFNVVILSKKRKWIFSSWSLCLYLPVFQNYSHIGFTHFWLNEFRSNLCCSYKWLPFVHVNSIASSCEWFYHWYYGLLKVYYIKYRDSFTVYFSILIPLINLSHLVTLANIFRTIFISLLLVIMRVPVVFPY